MAVGKAAASAVPPVADDDGEKPNADVKVKKAALRKAVSALRMVVSKKTANSNPLFEDTVETMTVQLNLAKHPERRHRDVTIRLPHPMYGPKSEVCFISRSPQKKYKELLLQKHPTPGLTKVIGIEKLKKNYQAPADKRALADAYDLFLCDRRVIEMMPKCLGVIFYKKKLKPPVPVALKESLADPKADIEKAIGGTTFRMPSGPCIGVRFGRVSMEEDELVANAAAVIASSIKLLDRHGLLLQSISVQATNNPALPVWRRAAPPGQRLNLKKYRSDAASSAASDTGASGVSDSEITGSDITSDAGETLSTRDTVSEVDTGSELDTAGETMSELDDEEDESVAPARKEDMPLVQGLKKKKRRREGAEVVAAAAAASAAVAAEEEPKKKGAKKKKKG